jgi:hypothetical protein
MKKLFIIMLSVTLLISCSSDDSAKIEGNILGTWFLVETNNIPDYTVDECTGQSNITFMADNTADSEFYNEVEGNCVSSADNGTWSSSDNSQYTFELPGLGEVTGVVTFESESRFRFNPNDFPVSSMTFEK